MQNKLKIRRHNLKEKLAVVVEVAAPICHEWQNDYVSPLDEKEKPLKNTNYKLFTRANPSVSLSCVLHVNVWKACAVCSADSRNEWEVDLPLPVSEWFFILLVSASDKTYPSQAFFGGWSTDVYQDAFGWRINWMIFLSSRWTWCLWETLHYFIDQNRFQLSYVSSFMYIEYMIHFSCKESDSTISVFNWGAIKYLMKEAESLQLKKKEN